MKSDWYELWTNTYLKGIWKWMLAFPTQCSFWSRFRCMWTDAICVVLQPTFTSSVGPCRVPSAAFAAAARPTADSWSSRPPTGSCRQPRKRLAARWSWWLAAPRRTPPGCRQPSPCWCRRRTKCCLHAGEQIEIIEVIFLEYIVNISVKPIRMGFLFFHLMGNFRKTRLWLNVFFAGHNSIGCRAGR